LTSLETFADAKPREIGNLLIGHLVLRKATLMVVREVLGGKYRLILVREDRAAAVCFERTFAERLLSAILRSTG